MWNWNKECIVSTPVSKLAATPVYAVQMNFLLFFLSIFLNSSIVQTALHSQTIKAAANRGVQYVHHWVGIIVRVAQMLKARPPMWKMKKFKIRMKKEKRGNSQLKSCNTNQKRPTSCSFYLFVSNNVIYFYAEVCDVDDTADYSAEQLCQMTWPSNHRPLFQRSWSQRPKQSDAE